MVVSITYSDQVVIRYKDSANLDYAVQNGTPIIHRGYNQRVQRLAKLIGVQLALARIDPGTPPVASPPTSPRPQ